MPLYRNMNWCDVCVYIYIYIFIYISIIYHCCIVQTSTSSLHTISLFLPAWLVFKKQLVQIRPLKVRKIQSCVLPFCNYQSVRDVMSKPGGVIIIICIPKVLSDALSARKQQQICPSKYINWCYLHVLHIRRILFKRVNWTTPQRRKASTQLC